jgi:poly-gamma-glutamate capsule biosynthesis protein CapA/YwtB (metallophosphatase superfamily)
LHATAEALAKRDIVTLGEREVTTGRPVVTPLGPIAVLAANLTPAALAPQSELPLPSPEQLAAAIAEAHRREPDRPILVLLHLGRELDSSAGDRERRYVRAAISAGAAAVVLSGAHVVRAQFLDHGVPVHLGLGNLLFDQHDPRTRRGALITLRLRPGRPAEPIATTCIDSLSGARLDCDDPLD